MPKNPSIAQELRDIAQTIEGGINHAEVPALIERLDKAADRAEELESASTGATPKPKTT